MPIFLHRSTTFCLSSNATFGSNPASLIFPKSSSLTSSSPLKSSSALRNNAECLIPNFASCCSVTFLCLSFLAEVMITLCPLSISDLITPVTSSCSTSFSSITFDHLFFTGSTSVGKLVMKAAAENLVPVTLELGGKSPTIIDNDIDIKTAVSRLILGKTLNAGQTCVAPDYIFCPENKVAELTQAFQTAYQSMYPSIEKNDDYSCIINDGQKSRLDSLLADAKTQGATITPLSKGSDDNACRKMPLTLITDVNDDMTVMQQEIFGPLLPIIGYKNISDAIAYINSKPRPLALYICSFNKSFQQQVLLNTHAGGVCINDAAFHVAVDDLPFGGIGASGMGQYHGDEGFKTFSHGKAVLSRGRISLGSLLFPPFGNKIHQILFKFFIR